VRTFAYARPTSVAEAAELLADDGARPLGGGTDLLPQLERGIHPATTVVDLRGLGFDTIEEDGAGLAIGATVRVADLARDDRIAGRYAALHQAARTLASPQLREMGTVGGNLCQHVRCWYYRHPDLRCWLRGGDTCYAQVGDHRKHGLEPGDCISVAPSDLAAPLLALDAEIETSAGRRMPIASLYRRATADRRSTLDLAAGEFLTAVRLPDPPDASAYARAGERHAWSFALVGVAAARLGGDVRLAAIGVANLPRELDPADPLAGLPGLEMTGWKRQLLAGLVDEALSAVR
jgi:xanthine dehydrogenase YagS FAD-binding subunit